MPLLRQTKASGLEAGGLDERKHMKKKLYVVVFLVCSLLPFAGMAFATTRETTENREMAAWPDSMVNGNVNLHYLNELGNYFEDHFAFRNWLVSIDSMIMCNMFKTSPNKTVVCGEKGWFYYTNTVNDYLGQRLMTKRELNNIAHNISLMQYYAEEEEADFLFTVAPNKNSLYGDNMPYYLSKKVSTQKNIDNLVPYLEEYEVNYLDLFQPFRDAEETLYLKRDSHWNNKGAAIAYHTILDRLGIKHMDVLERPYRISHDYVGDLNKMLFPRLAVPEDNNNYAIDKKWEFTEGKSVEDGYSATDNENGHGSLLMYRDSFGYTLLPLMANTFEEAVFVNEYPYAFGEEMEAAQPETVIVERVERELWEYLTDPPVMSALEVEETVAEEVEDDQGNASVTVRQDDENPSYWNLSGHIPLQYVKDDTIIYITIDDGKEIHTYEAYGINDTDFKMYLEGNELPDSKVEITVFSDEIPVCKRTVDISTLDWE